MKTSGTEPVGPLRCLPMMTSAIPCTSSRVGLVDLFAVDEDDEVGVLLDRARLAQVGEDRALVLARLDRARELRAGEDRDRRAPWPAPSASGRSARSPAGGSRRCAQPLGELQVVDDEQRRARARAFSRRALARISITPIAGVSSMKIGASVRRAGGVGQLGPLAFAAGSRCAAAAPARAPASRGGAARAAPCDISRQKTPTGSFVLIATCSAMLSTRLVFPIEGRPAMTIRSDFWKPEVMRSRSTKPVGDAGDGALVLVELLDDLEGRSCRTSLASARTRASAAAR